MARRYALDTNLYIDALRSADSALELEAFLMAYAPTIMLSAVVAQELRAGSRGAQVAEVDSAFIAPLEKRGRCFTPSYAAWKESGAILSAVMLKAEWPAPPRSFVNDSLLAMSCREAGVVLVTRNLRDCERIARVKKFDFTGPWP